MESIIFCGRCGNFISSDEITGGKASKINNIYYCLKCSTGPKPAQKKPSSPAIPSVGSGSAAKPAVAIPISQKPASTAIRQATAVPVQQKAGPIQSRTATSSPQMPSRQVATPAQKPSTTSPLLKQSIPVAQPSRSIPTQRTAPSTQPQKISQTSRLRPVPNSTSSDVTFGNAEEDAEIVSSLSRGGPKGGLKKVYIIAGAVIGVVILAIVIGVYLSNAAQDEADIIKKEKAKQSYTEIVETERDFPLDPQKVLDKIQERADSIKNSPYEEKVQGIEKTVRERLELVNKMKELERLPPPATIKDSDELINKYSKLKEYQSANKGIVERINESIKNLNQQRQKIVEEQKEIEKQKEAELKKKWDDFNAKIDALKKQKAYKEILELCEIFLGQPAHLKFQDEVDKIKTNTNESLEEEKELKELRKQPQVLQDDISKWDRQGATNSEIYVDDTKLLIKNPNPAGKKDGETLLISSEKWKDFTLEIAFRASGGSLDMLLRSNIPIELPRIFGLKENEWQEYTMELKGNKLKISGTRLPEKSTDWTGAKPTGPIILVIKGGDNIIIKELKVKIIE